MARDWTAGGAAQTGHLRAEVLRLLRGKGLASGAGVPPGGEVLVLGCGQARAGDTSETLPRHLRDTSEALRDTSETLPRHFRDI